jgi:hypothetical protein
VRARQALTLWFDQIDDLCAWVSRSVSDLLPAGIREFGWRDDAEIVTMGEGGEPVHESIRQVSLFGATRLRSSSGSPMPKRMLVRLRADHQFRKCLTLSHSACRRGRRALVLRQNEFSPISAEDGRFEYRVTDAATRSGVELEIAMVRRAHLEALSGHAEAQSRPWEIVGDVSPDGASSFRFERSAHTALNAAGWRAVAVYLVLIFSLFSWAERAERQLAQRVEAREAVVAAARTVRDTHTLLGQLEVRAGARGAETDLSALLSGLAMASENAAPDAAIERVSLDGQGGLRLQISITSPEGVETAQVEQALGDDV